MAHHDKGLAVNGKLVVELTVAALKLMDASIQDLEPWSVVGDLCSVPGDFIVVLRNLIIVVVDVVAGWADAGL